MPQEPERVQVVFLGEAFTVKGDATREQIRKTSDYLQEQLESMKTRFPTLTAKNIAILTAFTIADELIRVRKDYEALVSILDNE
jgi:cell division protein ZapA